MPKIDLDKLEEYEDKYESVEKFHTKKIKKFKDKNIK